MQIICTRPKARILWLPAPEFSTLMTPFVTRHAEQLEYHEAIDNIQVWSSQRPLILEPDYVMR
jgi:hypothetical protein